MEISKLSSSTVRWVNVVYCCQSSTHLDLVVQQRALLQALVEQTHLSDCVAADTVGVVVGAEQQAAQQGGKFKTCGSLTLQHWGGGEQVPGLRQQNTHLTICCTHWGEAVCVILDVWRSHLVNDYKHGCEACLFAFQARCVVQQANMSLLTWHECVIICSAPNEKTVWLIRCENWG